MHFALIPQTEASIPGQYTNSLACAFMPTTPWCVQNVGSAGLFSIAFWG